MKRIAYILALLLLAAACGSDEGSSTTTSAGKVSAEEPVTITLVTHDSFVVSPAVLKAFTKETGITVKVLTGGDAGEVVNQAILTKDDPQGDVLYGIDNTFLSRAFDEDLFEPYEAKGLDAVDARYVLDAERHRVTPIDYADVCLNYDKSYFAEHSLAPPANLDDLTKPAYKDLTVVENPATSSTGLAFLIGTVEEYGEDGWLDWWSDLRTNGVAVAAGWEEAYYGEFSGGTGSEGDRPIVVSYASSPPAEIAFAETPITEPPTAVVDTSCVRQVEMAGILTGAKHPEAAGRFIDFMLSKAFQEDMPLSMFVFPVDPDAALPEEFSEFAATPEHPYEVDADAVAANRDDWLEAWTDTVVR